MPLTRASLFRVSGVNRRIARSGTMTHGKWIEKLEYSLVHIKDYKNATSEYRMSAWLFLTS
jgi:hypothetical protein